MENLFIDALETLRERYSTYQWISGEVPGINGTEKMLYWPGNANEDIIIVVKSRSDELQVFHHHEYFYFNYVFSGQQEMLSFKYDHRVILRQNDIYAGQPFAGHAALPSENSVTTICILIKPEVMLQHFLPSLSSSAEMVNFLLNPVTDSFSQEIIHFNIKNDIRIKNLLELMVIEYAQQKDDTQDMLKPLVLAYLMQISRYYRQISQKKTAKSMSANIAHYISEHVGSVTLKDVAVKFSYHPNYISNLLKKEMGKTFSQILLERRMERALVLLQGTNLPIERISGMLGYSNPSNFHKAFKEFYHQSPREYVQIHKQDL